jgi:hypothetical protein
VPDRHPDDDPAGRLRRGSRPTGRRLPLLAGGMAVALLVAAACSGGSAVRTGQATGHHAAQQRSGQRRSASPGGPQRPDPAPMVLQVQPAPFQLPAGISGAAGLARGRDLMIVGGSTLARPATRSVLGLDPVSGRTWPAGELAAPVTGSAGAQLAWQPVVFGGRAADAALRVQAVPAARTAPIGRAVQAAGASRVGQRDRARPGGTAQAAGSTPPPGAPSARSGLAAVTVGGTAYLLGGCGAGRFPAEVAGTRDGRHFRTVARLPVPACYAAAAAIGNRVWLFGGRTAAGPTDVIQQVDLASGTAHVIGHLPHRLAGAAAFVLNGTIYLAGGTAAAASPTGTWPTWAGPTSAAVFRYEPSSGQLTVAGQLPVPVAGAAAAVIGETAYLIGGTDGRKLVPAITTLRLVRPPARPDPPAAPWLSAARGRGRLAPGSQPAALPADVLIADHLNNRLVIIDPQGRLRWVFPRPHDLRRGQAFLVPDDAFFSPDGRYIIATQEDDQVISVIDVASHKIIYRYGAPGRPGMGPNRVDNPDDAMLMPGGDLITADIKNCRVLIIRPPAHRPLKIIGSSSNFCIHDPPIRFGSPNGAFPMTDGHYLVTEINGDWASEMNLTGHIYWSVRPPAVAYPSDSNEIYPGRYLTVDYSRAGQVVEFDAAGRTLWRMRGLNHPSLALPLPNGNILVNDDFNDRVIVIDPATHRIVWQYGHTGVAAARPGYLNDPDGVDLVPPDSLLITHAATMGQP